MAKPTASYWSPITPSKDGWYWVKYKNKRNVYTVCPARVSIIGDTRTVHSAYNDTFIEGPNHGGQGLKCDGKLDKSIRFGSKIRKPPV